MRIPDQECLNTPATLTQNKATAGKVIDGRKTTNNLLATYLTKFWTWCSRRVVDCWLFPATKHSLLDSGDLADSRRKTNSEPSGNVDKGVFTSFLNAKNVFPVVVWTSAAECSESPRDPDFAHFPIFDKKNHYFAENGPMLGACTLTRTCVWSFRLVVWCAGVAAAKRGWMNTSG